MKRIVNDLLSIAERLRAEAKRLCKHPHKYLFDDDGFKVMVCPDCGSVGESMKLEKCEWCDSDAIYRVRVVGTKYIRYSCADVNHRFRTDRLLLLDHGPAVDTVTSKIAPEDGK